MGKKNSLIFSVTYESYLKVVRENKENKTLGTWNITPEAVNELKYAYAYLKNSKKMIVKKFEIDHFELSDPKKGYDDDLQCFIFKSSEDVFFEYPYSTVQGRHYRNNEEMDALLRLDKIEVNRRLELSKKNTSFSESNRKEKRNHTGVAQEAQTRLMKLFKSEYSDRQMPHFEISKKMIATVEADQEQDLNALLDEYYLKEDKKNSSLLY